METLTINLSTLLFHSIIYYICFNSITILIGWGDNFANQTKTIKKILNPFRDFKIEYFGAFILLMILSLIPYSLIIWIDYLISTIKLNIIW